MADYIFTAQEVVDALTILSTLEPKKYDLTGWESSAAAWYKLVACRKEGGKFVINSDSKVRFIRDK